MSNYSNLQVSGSPEDLLHFLADHKQPVKVSVIDRIYDLGADPDLKRVVVTVSFRRPDVAWFERNGKLTSEEAAELEACTYGKRKRA